MYIYVYTVNQISFHTLYEISLLALFIKIWQPTSEQNY